MGQDQRCLRGGPIQGCRDHAFLKAKRKNWRNCPNSCMSGLDGLCVGHGLRRLRIPAAEGLLLPKPKPSSKAKLQSQVQSLAAAVLGPGRANASDHRASGAKRVEIRRLGRLRLSGYLEGLVFRIQKRTTRTPKFREIFVTSTCRWAHAVSSMFGCLQDTCSMAEMMLQ